MRKRIWNFKVFHDFQWMDGQLALFLRKVTWTSYNRILIITLFFNILVFVHF